MNKFSIGIFGLSLLLISCQSGKGPVKNESNAVQVKQGLSIHRYEKAIFSLDPQKLRSGLAGIYPEYSLFLGKDWQDTMNLLRMYNFINDDNIKELYKLVIKNYPDTAQLQSDLFNAFKNATKYFPRLQIPTVYTYVSGLDIDEPVIYSDSAMVIGLDLYLGKDVAAYRKAGIPEYKISGFTRDRVIPECMLAVAGHLIKTNEENLSLLDQMIAAGKTLYFLDQVIPDTKDEFKIGYPAEKLDWAKQNEGNIWAFIIGNQLLYTSDPKVSGKLMVDAPFTSGLVNESPGRIGEWVGWQIVKAYMSENSSVTLEQLMDNTDSQSILRGSKYKPRK
ncbi:MAG: hypothetical protein HXX13_12930 [Bacteroidetes bacterium]|nr:hypothetical protein [Bacteroidota bacterium]